MNVTPDDHMNLPTQLASEPSVTHLDAVRPLIPGYEILGELGRGGMGVVYKALHVQLKRVVALKMILAGNFPADPERRRFIKEAESLARLQHPNIIQIFEVGEHAGQPFFSLEYLDGGNLAQKIAGTPLPARQAAQLVETLARAMHTAHQHGLVHRDLKPANILLGARAEGQRGGGEEGNQPRSGIASAAPPLCPSAPLPLLPKITDFGLVKDLVNDAGHTRTGAIMGTPSYMAPEQASGEGHTIGFAADVYALGAILYECLTGQPPFKAATAFDTVLMVLDRDPVSLRRLNGEVPRDLEIICLKCLSKETGKRYDSALSLAEDLRRFLDGVPIQARPISAGERAFKWARRRPAVAALLSVVIVGLATGIPLLVGLWLRAESLRKQAEAAGAEARHRADTEEELRTTAEQAREDTTRALYRSERTVATLHLERGRSLCEHGEIGLGLLELARALELAPADATDIQHTARLQISAWQPYLPPLHHVLVHGNGVRHAMFSPDVKQVVTDGNRRLCVWDALKGTMERAIDVKDEILVAVYSPDGRIVATGCNDGSVSLWDPWTGKSLGGPLKHNAAVRALSFSPDGQLLVAGTGLPYGNEPGEMRLWNTTTLKEAIPRIQLEHCIGALAFARDGKQFAAGLDRARQPGFLHRYEAATGKALDKPIRFDQGVSHLQYNADGSKLLVSNDRVFVVDLKTQKVGGNWLGRGACFSPDGQRILAGSDQYSRFHLFSAADGSPVGQSMRHQGPGSAVAYFPYGQWLATGGSDRTVRLWDANTTEPIGSPLLHPSPVLQVGLSPGGNILTRDADNAVRLWWLPDPKAGLPVVSLNAQGANRVGIFSPDSKTILAGDQQGGNRWDVLTGKKLGPVLHHSNFLAVACSPDQKRIVTGDIHSGSVIVWDYAGGTVIKRAAAHQASIRDVAISSDGRLIATASSDGSAKVWPMDALPIEGKTLTHQAIVREVEFSPDGQLVATACEDRHVYLWNPRTGERVGAPLAHPGVVVSLAFHPQGKRLLTGCGDGLARIWDIATGEVVGPSFPVSGEVSTVAFCPDGRTILTGSGDARAQLWQAETGHAIGKPIARESGVATVATSPDGKRFLVAGNYGTMDVYAMPQPIAGTPEQVRVSLQVRTGMELSESGLGVPLSPEKWRERVKRLNELNSASSN